MSWAPYQISPFGTSLNFIFLFIFLRSIIPLCFGRNAESGQRILTFSTAIRYLIMSHLGWILFVKVISIFLISETKINSAHTSVHSITESFYLSTRPNFVNVVVNELSSVLSFISVWQPVWDDLKNDSPRKEAQQSLIHTIVHIANLLLKTTFRLLDSMSTWPTSTEFISLSATIP